MKGYLDDASIIALFLNRIETAISETKSKYGKLIKMIAYNILQDRFESEECENDTYLTLWNNIPPTIPKSLKAYSLKISRNQALKKYDFNHAEKRNVDKNVSFEKIVEDGDQFFEKQINTFEDDELTECLNDFIAGLEKRNRKVFLLKYWYFMTVNEIMAECGLSKSQVESILFRERKKLKRELLARRIVSD